MSELFICIFFIYFVLLSGITTRVLGCSVQKKMRDSPISNHMILFFAVFFFTYVLNWYNFYGIGDTENTWVERVEKEGFGNNEHLFNNDKLNFLKLSFIKSILIYFIFILSTKMTGTGILIFFMAIFAFIMTQVLLKSFNLELYNYLIKKNIFYVKDKDIFKKKYKNEKKLDSFITIYNGLNISYAILLLYLIVNSYQYYKQQVKSHRKNFNLIKFLLGTNKCRGEFI
tara:strand:- start:9158 stop:9841 length:684 start_codon:yes stop_codon:yes gene_type:complete